MKSYIFHKNTNTKILAREANQFDLPKIRDQICMVQTQDKKAGNLTVGDFGKYKVDPVLYSNSGFHTVIENPENGQIVAGVLTIDFYSFLQDIRKNENLDKMPYYFQVYRHLFSQFENQFIQMFGYPKKGEVAYFFGQFVEQNYRKGSISQEQIRKTVEFCQQKGFKKVMGIGINSYAVKACMKAGMKPVMYMNYSDFEFKGNNFFQDTNQKHVVMGVADLEKDIGDQTQHFELDQLLNIKQKQIKPRL